MRIKRCFIVLLFAFLFLNTENTLAQNSDVKKERRRDKKQRKKLSENNIQTAIIFNEPLTDTTISIVDTIASNTTNSTEINTIVNELELIKETAVATIAESTNSNALQQVAETPKTHIAQANETIYTIARKYDIPVATLIKANKLSSTGIKEGQIIILSALENVAAKNTVPEKVISPNEKPKEQAIEAELVEQKNELEKKFENLPSNTFTQTTALEKPMQLEAAKIKDENVTTHITQENESLYTIARKYDVPVAALIKANKLSSTEIKTGQKIYLSADTVSISNQNTASNTTTKPTDAATSNVKSKKAEKVVEIEKTAEKTVATTQSILANTNTKNKLAPGTILIGCYAGHNNEAADILKNRLQEKGHESGYLYIPDYEPQGKKLYRVYVGPYNNYTTAKVALKEIHKFRPEAYIFTVK